MNLVERTNLNFPLFFSEVWQTPALIIAIDITTKLKERIPMFFDDYQILELSSQPDRYYEEAHKVDVARSYHPIFLITHGNPTFNAIVAARLATKLRSFFIAEPQEERFRILDAI